MTGTGGAHDSDDTTADEPHGHGQPWLRLSGRVIAVDLARSGLSLVPAVFALTVLGLAPTWGSMWPFIAIAVWGILGACADMLRWLFTRYRVTDLEVHRRTGVVTKHYRTVKRDRIRSVDINAQWHHRLAGLRVVAIGAGQQMSAGESAFTLDALSKHDAEGLRRTLMRDSAVTVTHNPRQAPGGRDGETASAATIEPHPATASAPPHARPSSVLPDPSIGPDPDADPAAVADAESTPGEPQSVTVLQTLRPWWVVYNMVGVWAFVTAIGLLWGAFWLLQTFGVDAAGWLVGLADWEALGWPATIGIAVLAAVVIGAIGMGANFYLGYWNFELARVRTANGSFLRTRRGLLSTREVNRDESRIRGLTISEPLLWRWIRMADTTVITTGLGIWSTSTPTSPVPRGPLSVAHEVAADVLGRDDLLTGTLRAHPPASLRRRLWWATLVGVAVAGAVAWPAISGVAPTWVWWIPLGLWVLALLGAVAAWAALGHDVRGDYLVVRSGLMSRNWSALRRDAVSTVAIRQSVLQRRLGLATVSAMTAAGWLSYEAPDVDANEAVALAAAAAPGLLDPYVNPPARP